MWDSREMAGPRRGGGPRRSPLRVGAPAVARRSGIPGGSPRAAPSPPAGGAGGRERSRWSCWGQFLLFAKARVWQRKMWGQGEVSAASEWCWRGNRCRPCAGAGSLGGFWTFRLSPCTSTGRHRGKEEQAAYSEGHRWAVGGDESGRVSSESSKVSILVEGPVCLCPSRSSLARAHRS